eukprot:jgi/Mesvir1/457/Mv11335-RA.1
MARGRATASNAKKKSKPPSRAKGTHRRHRVRAHDTGHDEPVERTSGHEAAGDAAGSGQGGFSWEAFLTSDDPPPGPGDTGSSDDPPWLQRHAAWRAGRDARERAREEAWAERERQRLADPEAFRRAQKAARESEWRADMIENAPEIKLRQFRNKETERTKEWYHREKERKQQLPEKAGANDLEAFLMSEDPPWIQRHTAWREGRPARERAREEAWAERERQRLADPEAFRRAQEAADEREWRADMIENATRQKSGLERLWNTVKKRSVADRDWALHVALMEKRQRIDKAIHQARDREMREKEAPKVSLFLNNPEPFPASDDPSPGPGVADYSVADLEAFLMSEDPPWIQRHAAWREGRPARERAREEAWAERERRRLADPEAFRIAEKAAADRERRADITENAPEKYRQYLKKKQELKVLAIQKEKERIQRAITERKHRLTEKAGANDLEAFLMPEPPPWLQRHTEWREGGLARERAREEAWAERERQRLADPEAFQRRKRPPATASIKQTWQRTRPRSTGNIEKGAGA